MYNLETCEEFISIMNDYAGMFLNDGNSNVVAAIGRMANAIEESGYKIGFTDHGYILLK